MVRLAILADDLTGAADAGGGFAGLGLSTLLLLGGRHRADAEVLVRSTGSRGLPVAEAIAVNREMAANLPDHRLTYKKIDSMLRGHPCAELGAVMDGREEVRALIAPALPVERRTTVGGYQRIGGGGRTVDLVATFGCRPDLPVRRLDLWTVQQGGESVARAIELAGPGLLIADAVTESDLAAIAHGAIESGIRVVAGAAGLARHLAAALAGERVVPDPTPVPGPVLVVAASRNPATAAQIHELAAAGLPVVRPPVDLLHGDEADHSQVAAALVAALAAGGSAVLTTAGMDASRQGGAFVASMLAEIVASVAERSPLCGLVLTGGDVAAAVISRLGGQSILLGGEVRPAIPWGALRSSLISECRVVTKAGSFGDPDALLACVRSIRGTGEP